VLWLCRFFSLEQYMDWYAARCGNFTYYQDWSGFFAAVILAAVFCDLRSCCQRRDLIDDAERGGAGRRG
jgi:hypothetical protein